MDVERDFERCDETVGGHRIGDVRNYDIASPPALAHFLANPMRSQTLLRVGSTLLCWPQASDRHGRRSKGQSHWLCGTVRDTFTQASMDGSLSKALSSSKSGDMDVEQLRTLASKTLAQGSNYGSLTKALSSSRSGDMDVEQLRETSVHVPQTSSGACSWHKCRPSLPQPEELASRGGRAAGRCTAVEPRITA